MLICIRWKLYMVAKITSGFKFYLENFVNLKGEGKPSVQQSEQDWMRIYFKQRRK